MKDRADAEFFDDELEAQIKAAFSRIEPSVQTQARMQANLLAYEQQHASASGVSHSSGTVAQQGVAATGVTAGVTAPLGVGSEAVLSDAQMHVNAEAIMQDGIKLPLKADVEKQQRALTEAEGVAAKEGEEETQTPKAMSGEAADIVAAARKGKPLTKRRIRPWQIAVPAAAVLILGAVLVVAGPLTGALSLGGNKDLQQEAALDEVATEAASEEEIEGEEDNYYSDLGLAEETETASASNPEEGEEAAIASEGAEETPQDSEADNSVDEVDSVDSASAAAEEDASQQESSSDTSETAQQSTNYPQDYPTIVVVINGVEYRLVIDSTTAAEKSVVGTFAYDANAYNSGETDSVACAIYEPAQDSDTYYISYVGEDIYYPSHVIE